MLRVKVLGKAAALLPPLTWGAVLCFIDKNGIIVWKLRLTELPEFQITWEKEQNTSVRSSSACHDLLKKKASSGPAPCLDMTFRRIAKFCCSQMLLVPRWLREGWNKVKKSSLTTPVEGSYADDLIAQRRWQGRRFSPVQATSGSISQMPRRGKDVLVSARSTPSASTHLPTAWHRISMILLPIWHIQSSTNSEAK